MLSDRVLEAPLSAGGRQLAGVGGRCRWAGRRLTEGGAKNGEINQSQLHVQCSIHAGARGQGRSPCRFEDGPGAEANIPLGALKGFQH